MVSTVTTTTVAVISMPGMASALGLVAILTLLAVLIQKEVATSVEGPLAAALSRVLNVALAPLLMAFAFIASVTLWKFFS